LNALEVYIFDNAIDADREHNILDNIWRQRGARYHEFAIRLHGRLAGCLLVFSPDNAYWPHDVTMKKTFVEQTQPARCDTEID